MFKNDSDATILELKKKLDAFVEARQWKKFHTLKNISMAFSVEASGLMELLLWTDSEHSKLRSERFIDKKQEIEIEIADIFYYTLTFCNVANIYNELVKAFEHKLNAQKYPVEKYLTTDVFEIKNDFKLHE